jgi:hypothetical protein
MHKPPCRPRPKCARYTAPAKSRILIVRFQNISDTSVDNFRDGKGETVIWPNRYKAGDVILPYSSIMHCGQGLPWGARNRNVQRVVGPHRDRRDRDHRAVVGVGYRD